AAETDLSQMGVMVNEEGKAYKGINIFHSEEKQEAYLMDLEGNIIHTWRKAYRCENGCAWHHVEMDREGNLYVIWKHYLIIKLDWNSSLNLGAFQRNRPHHDMEISDEGEVLSLQRGFINISCTSPECPVTVIADAIMLMNQSLEPLQTISLYPLFVKDINLGPDVFKQRDQAVLHNNSEFFDTLHANSIETLPRDVSGLGRKGDALISLRAINTIAVIDLSYQEVVWRWGAGDVVMQHHPTLLDNDHVLLFDNRGNEGYSRVIELDPVSKEIVWDYRGKPPESFFSPSRGANQRLPNGNTLITESDKGHVFEITPQGEIVWEFWNPSLNENNEREVIYRMMRITPAEINSLPWDEKTQSFLKENGYLT
ncbi:MAG: arylsulfotransferase family protein, partial [Nanoarchaeota archaeon]